MCGQRRPLARGPLSVWGLPERDVKQSRWRTAQVEWGRVGGVRETGQVRRSLGGGSLGWRSPRALEGVRKQFAPFPPFEYGRRPGCRPAVGKRRCAEGRRLPVSSQSPLSQNGLSLGRPALGLFSAPPSAARSLGQKNRNGSHGREAGMTGSREPRPRARDRALRPSSGGRRPASFLYWWP